MNDLRKVIIVSGAKSNYYTDKIDEIGLQQVAQLIPAVEKAIIDERRVKILSSALSHSKDTAESIMRKLSLPCEVDSLLGGSKTFKRDSLSIVSLIKSTAAEHHSTAVIVVIEKDYCNQLSRHILKSYNWDLTEFKPMHEGEVIVLDIVNGILVKVWDKAS
jgi:hypothetical protein